jgi:hypothetical protein
MARYRYKVIPLPEDDDLEAALNRLGTDGWKLVCAESERLILISDKCICIPRSGDKSNSCEIEK